MERSITMFLNKQTANGGDILWYLDSKEHIWNEFMTYYTKLTDEDVLF